MKYQNKDKQNIIYIIIGILTLILTTTSATFAYFTATDDESSTITGNMATIKFSITVDKMTTTDENKGLIPLSNSMVESALTKNASVPEKGICIDDNGNAVCQIYKITATNESTANMFIDGYVSLTGGSGTPTDLEGTNNKTTMRWTQVFCDETNNVISNCTTAGITTTSATKSNNGDSNGITTNWSKIENKSTEANSGYNREQILTSGITTKAIVSDNEYDIINKNFIRISDHKSTEKYSRSKDVTSSLVYNEFLNAQNETANPTGGSNNEYTDSQVYYIAVWLSETGTNQTVTEENKRINFFSGTVQFISSQGSEVTATFSDYTSVKPNTLTQ